MTDGKNIAHVVGNAEMKTEGKTPETLPGDLGYFARRSAEAPPASRSCFGPAACGSVGPYDTGHERIQRTDQPYDSEKDKKGTE